MHGVCDAAPASDVVGGIDLSSLVPAPADDRDVRAFGDEQAGGSALGVVVGHEMISDVGGPGTAAGHGRHDDAVGKGEIAEQEGGEKVRVEGRGGGGHDEREVDGGRGVRDEVARARRESVCDLKLSVGKGDRQKMRKRAKNK